MIKKIIYLAGVIALIFAGVFLYKRYKKSKPNTTVAGIKIPMYIEAGTTDYDKEIGITILNQMGGAGRINQYLGLDWVRIIKNGVMFKVKVRGENSINCFQITLDRGSDTYNWVSGMYRTDKFKPVYYNRNVYCDELVSLHNEQTKNFLPIVHFG